LAATLACRVTVDTKSEGVEIKWKRREMEESNEEANRKLLR
jgi:hypothetical protein